MGKLIHFQKRRGKGQVVGRPVHDQKVVGSNQASTFFSSSENHPFLILIGVSTPGKRFENEGMLIFLFMLLAQAYKRNVWGQQETKNPQEILNAKMSQVTKKTFFSALKFFPFSGIWFQKSKTFIFL